MEPYFRNNFEHDRPNYQMTKQILHLRAVDFMTVDQNSSDIDFDKPIVMKYFLIIAY